MNVGWDQIGGMYGIYHFIFFHAFLHDTAIHAVSNIGKIQLLSKGQTCNFSLTRK